MAENFAHIGLTLDVNADLLSDKHKLAAVHAAAAKRPAGDTTTVKELEALAAQATSYESYMAQGDFLFVQKLIERHGETNFVAMARDHEINYYQHAPKYLEKKVGKYIATLKKLASMVVEENE